MLITALGSWKKLVPRGQPIYDIIGSDVVQEGAVWLLQPVYDIIIKPQGAVGLNIKLQIQKMN